MKKLIPSILFAVLASFSLLLAQSESKQVTGYREQGTGCRLQVAGSDQETDSREATLLLGDKISQRTEPTTNYNDQVTGCRLQVVGSDQETDCREQLTDTNQVAGCRLQALSRKQGPGDR